MPITFKGATKTSNSDNQLSVSGFGYDGDGNATTYYGTTLGFDPENRMVTEGSTWSAAYRADGRRAWKTVSGTKTYYLYDEGNPVVELNSSGTVTAVNVFAPDGLVARKQGGSWIDYCFDPQGNVAQRLSSSGTVLSSSIYDVYGVESNSGTVSDTFGYNAKDGYYLDRETGFYLCDQRYYDPGTGRWVTRDPIGVGGGPNVYAYCSSSPVSNTDATGLCQDPLDEGFTKKKCEALCFSISDPNGTGRIGPLYRA